MRVPDRVAAVSGLSGTAASGLSGNAVSGLSSNAASGFRIECNLTKYTARAHQNRKGRSESNTSAHPQQYSAQIARTKESPQEVDPSRQTLVFVASI
jgi:hypothetical protein